MNAAPQNESNQNKDFQLGLLNFVHLLVMVDGVIDQRETKAILAIKEEENISDQVFNDFNKSLLSKTERQIYVDAVDRLNRCTEEEKLCAFVHLHRLSEADENIDVKEVRFMLYSLKAAKIDIEDVVLSARMSKAARV